MQQGLGWGAQEALLCMDDRALSVEQLDALSRAVPEDAERRDLLAYLADNAGLALSRQQLLDGVWGSSWYGDERTVDVHVGQLRKKLGDALPLATVWGVGYRLA